MDEFIAAKPHDRVGGADALDHVIRHGFQEHVARVVTEAIVDQLEVVEIEEDHGHPAVVPLRLQNGLGKPIHEQDAVWQPG
jgi:hypothetical protein